MALLEAQGPVWFDDELHDPGALSPELAVLMGTALGMSPACHLRGDALLDEHLASLAEGAAALGYHGVDAASLRDALGELPPGPNVLALVPGPAAHRATPPGEDWALVRWHGQDRPGGAIDAVVSPSPRNRHSPAAGVLLLDDTELLAGSRAAHAQGRDACGWLDLDGRLSCVDQGALVLRLDGRLVTPSTSCGAIRTAWRDALVREGVIEERELVVDDLRRAEGAACFDPWASVRSIARVDDIELASAAAAAEELAVLVAEMIGDRS